MPPCCWRSRPAPCPPRLGGRRPRRRPLLPPPPDGRPGPAFILFSCVSCDSIRPEGGRESAFLTCRSLDGALCHAQSTCAETPIQVEFSLENLCPLGARSQWARRAS